MNSADRYQVRSEITERTIRFYLRDRELRLSELPEIVGQDEADSLLTAALRAQVGMIGEKRSEDSVDAFRYAVTMLGGSAPLGTPVNLPTKGEALVPREFLGLPITLLPPSKQSPAWVLLADDVIFSRPPLQFYDRVQPRFIPMDEPPQRYPYHNFRTGVKDYVAADEVTAEKGEELIPQDEAALASYRAQVAAGSSPLVALRSVLQTWLNPGER